MFFSSLLSNLQNQAEKNFYELGVITNNINSANTPGYKTERFISFEDTLTEEAKKSKQRYMEPGTLNITKNPDDVSIEGKGFFVMKDKEGELALTRNLTLGVNKEGYLTSGKNLVFPKVKVSNKFIGLEITEKGIIKGKVDDGSKIKIGELQVVNYPAANKLEYDGFLFRPSEEAGKPERVCLGETSQAKVRQGTLESSNVDAPLEFTKFNMATQKLRTISQLTQLLNSVQRTYIQNLSSSIG
ncbi:MAG TPA: flagellar hook basal-body protein [Vampirovibrionales bacterium]